MNRAYAPSVVLAVWAVLSALGASLAPFMLVVMTWSVIVMLSDLIPRYRDKL